MEDQPDNEQMIEQAEEPIDEQIADMAQPQEQAPRRRRLTKPLVTAVAAGVIGVGVGAGAVALVGGHDDGHGRNGDHRGQMADDDQWMPGQRDGQQQRDGQGMPGQRDGQQQRGGQQGGFMPPNGGGQSQGRTGGS